MRELLIAGVVGLPCLTVVLATNHTATRELILAHAMLLLWLVPSFYLLLQRLLAPRQADSLFLAIGLRLGAVLLASALMVLVLHASTNLSWSALVGGPLFIALIPVCLAYLFVASLDHAARLRERSAQLAMAEARAREAALTARIRPHFLFNALTCIEELTHSDASSARLAVQHLSRLLRGVLHSSTALTTTLEVELSLVADYLSIEQVRFGTRLRVNFEIESSARSRMIPATILLTLVENAIKHGVEATAGEATIHVRARLMPKGQLSLHISSPLAHRELTLDSAKGGYGLSDIRERLTLHYAGQAQLQLEAREGEFHVELNLPA